MTNQDLKDTEREISAPVRYPWEPGYRLPSELGPAVFWAEQKRRLKLIWVTPFLILGSPIIVIALIFKAALLRHANGSFDNQVATDVRGIITWLRESSLEQARKRAAAQSSTDEASAEIDAFIASLNAQDSSDLAAVPEIRNDSYIKAQERKPERHNQILIAAISAASGVLVALISVFGTLRATDSLIVQGGTAGPTVERTVTVAPTATETVTVDPGSSPAPTDQPTANETALDANWATTAEDYYEEYGKVVVFDCPPAGIPQAIWGGPLYRVDSSVCTAAVHDGRITLKKGGRVTVEIREGAEEYKASRRNGITSEEANAASTSFEFLPRL